ncbi:MAG: YybS family protein [Deltaproteobacteria bacterium]|nr:YybS family protein [Deltaproteobacteria bacterium]
MKITDVAGCVAWAGLLFLAAMGIPIIGPFLSLLIPLPFLYYSTKLGLYAGLMLAALTTVTIGVGAKMAGYPHVALFCLEFSLLGLILSVLFRRNIGFARILFWGTVSMLTVGLILLVAIAFSKNMGVMEMMRGYLEAQFTGTLKAYQGAAGLPQDQVVELEAFGKALAALFIRVYPSLMVLGTLFAVWLNVGFAKPLFRIGRLPYPDFSPLDRWQAPEYLVWGVIASGFALIFFDGGLQLAAVNALIVLAAVYAFQGISIVLFFLNKYNVAPWLRIGVYILIFLQQIFVALLAIAGLFDQWFDFRKIHRKGKADEPKTED